MQSHLRAALVVLISLALAACGGTARHTYAVADDAEPEIRAPRVTKPAPRRNRGVATVASLRPIPIDPSILEGHVDDEPTEATTYASWAEYTHDHRFDCVGPLDQLAAPSALPLDHGSATLHGWHLDWQPPAGASAHVTVGVLGATKDAYEDTLANLDHFLAAFDVDNLPADLAGHEAVAVTDGLAVGTKLLDKQVGVVQEPGGYAPGADAVVSRGDGR